MVLNMSNLYYCRQALSSPYTDQNGTTEHFKYEWNSPQVLSFLQLDLLSYLKMVEYTEMTFNAIIEGQWLWVGSKGTQAFTTACYTVYRHYRAAT